MSFNEEISVITIHDHQKKQNKPLKIKWRNRTYKISKIGYHYKVHVGKTLHHIFSVTDGNNFFKLNYNTDSLSWKLEEMLTL
jgi:ribosomal protein S19